MSDGMRGALRKIMPARTNAQDFAMILDLDDMIEKPVGFRFKGRLFQLNPVDTETFMRLTGTLGEIGSLINRLNTGGGVSEDEIYQKYYEFVTSLCPDFMMADLKKMRVPQVHALVNLIIKQVTGQPMSGPAPDEKKKLTT